MNVVAYLRNFGKYSRSFFPIWRGFRRHIKKVTLESIAGELVECSEEEKNALAEAANELLKEEQESSLPREEFIQGYRDWMENMFLDENWKDNKRVV